MFKWLLRIFIAGAVAALLFVLVIAGIIFYYQRGLPGTETLSNYQPQVMTRIHAGDGRLLAEFAAERRVFVPINAIPKRVAWAFIATEDKDFFTHHGVDPRGMMRAALTNLMNFGSNRRPEGGSTITQQVAKNFLLGNEISFTRKFKELILAVRIDRTMTKEHILELYLNEIYLGGGSYGIAAAATNYFDKSLDQLTVAETAFLAALPKAPNNYNPLLYPDRALERRNWVISRMRQQNIISDEEAEQALASPLTLHSKPTTEVITADYFAEAVRRELASRYGENALYKGGLAVRTSLDPRLQRIAERSFRNGLLAYDMRHGYRGPISRGSIASLVKRLAETTPLPMPSSWSLAGVTRITSDTVEIALRVPGRPNQTTPAKIAWNDMLWVQSGEEEQLDTKGKVIKIQKPGDVLQVGDVILVEPMGGKTTPADAYQLRQIPTISGGFVALDPHTGRVLAMVGGWDYNQSQFNRATQAIRQPGSAFKPFVYMAALDSGMTPSTIVLDTPFVVEQEDGTKWNPANFGEKFLGPMPLRMGIEESRNLMTVRIAQSIGMDKVGDYAEKFGVVDRLPHYLASSIGAVDTNLMRMTTAFAMIVNGGKKIRPSLIDRVQDHDGRTIFKHDNRPCPGCSELSSSGQPPQIPDPRVQVVSPATAFQMVSLLESVVTRGTGAVIGGLRRPLAGKTGTTNDNTDAWFVGFSPDLAVGVYLGFDKPESLGEKETGSRNGAIVFRDFMAEALAGTPPIPFRTPPGIKMVKINPNTGKASNAAGSIWEAYKTGTTPGSGGEGSDTGGGGGGGGENDNDSSSVDGQY
ncbi:MAG: penicillin-binding protein 1A [Candidatus Pacebacteria bacterium]|nr:penicillin-binding protein 1A [Candidatus Paceibacterota bacterium]